MNIKPVEAWGIATKNGHGKFSMTFAVKSTRKELFEHYPWIKNAKGYKAVRITIRPFAANRSVKP